MTTSPTTIAVVGGTGTLGRLVVAELQAAGADVRVLSRSAPQFPVDLTTGAGLAAALAGCDVVVDASNGSPRAPRAVLVDGAGRLVTAAAEAGVGHLVLASIVGVDGVPARYQQAKVAQEEVVRAGAVPWSIVRATQFHELVDAALSALARFRVLPRMRAPLQPVAAAEAAAQVAAVALGGPTFATRNVAGPQTLPISALARQWAARRGVRGVAVPLPLGPAVRKALRAGALTCEDPDVTGEVTFETWLATG